MTVAVPGAELFYTTRGRGPACIVLSMIGTVPYERMMPTGLDDHLQLVFVDPRGAGRSTGDTSDLTFDVLAEDLDAVRRDVGATRIAVLGHSILGVLAIEYGRRCPETVSHVLTVGTPPHGNATALTASGAALFDTDASVERKQILRDNLAGLPAAATPGQSMLAQTPMRFGDPHFDAAPLFAGAEIRPAFFQHLFATLTASWDAGIALADLQPPLWLAQGRFDYISPGMLWDPIIPRCPRVTRCIFSASGHQPFLEEPDRFVHEMCRWMESHGRQ